MKDLCSYKREFLSGDADYNAVTVAMTQLGTDLTGAVQWVSNLHDEIADKFLKTLADVEAHRNGIPSWGAEMDSAVLAYINGLGTHLICLPLNTPSAGRIRHPWVTNTVTGPSLVRHPTV